MRTIKRIVFTIIVLLVAAVLVLHSLSNDRSVATGLANAAELQAVEAEFDTISAGPKPEDWPRRLFIPASFLRATVQLFSGVEITIPVGKQVDGHVDGYLHVDVESAELNPEDAKMGVRLTALVRYEPDRLKPKLSLPLYYPRARVAVDSILRPIEQYVKAGVLLTKFQILPSSITILPSWMPRPKAYDGLVGDILATEVKARMSDALVFSIPSVSPLIPVDTSFKSSTHVSFGTLGSEGSTDLVLTMDRPERHLGIPLERCITTRSGLWLLSGQPVAHSVRQELDVSQVENRRSELIQKLAPFQKTGEQIELTIPATDLLAAANGLLEPSPISIHLASTSTTGMVSKVVAHNAGVADIGVELRPKGEDFILGQMELQPQRPVWSSQNGLRVSVTANAKVVTSLDLHLDTGIGGGFGNSIGLETEGQTSIPLQASFEKRAVANGTAVILQPQIACTPINLQAKPTAVPQFANWLTVSPISLQLIGTIGGNKISPLVIADGLPIVLELPQTKDADGRLIDHDPNKTIIVFQHPFVGLSLVPQSVEMMDSGVIISVQGSVASRDSRETEAEATKRDQVKAALNDSAPKENCTSINSLVVSGGDVGVDVLAEGEFIYKNLLDHVEVSKKILENLATFNLAKLPQNLGDAIKASVNEPMKIGDHAIQQAAQVAKSAADKAAQAKKRLEEHKNLADVLDPGGLLH